MWAILKPSRTFERVCTAANLRNFKYVKSLSICHRSLGIELLQGPVGGGVLMSEVPLYEGFVSTKIQGVTCPNLNYIRPLRRLRQVS